MQVIEIDKYIIEVPNSRIGIFLSGGADSALLLYILLKFTTRPIRVYTIANLERHGLQSVVASNILNTCVQLTNNSSIRHNIWYTTSFTQEYINQKLAEPVETNEVDCIFTGTTALPNRIDYTKFIHKADNYSEKERDSRIIKKTVYNNDRLRVPFLNYDKKDVSSMYKHLGIVDSIFPLTRSCFIERENHCGSCFWCEERMWAFGKL